PAFMIPRNLVMVSRLPRTARGDADHSRLPVVHATRDNGSARTPLERSVIDTFADRFGRGAVGLDDDFLALGGSRRDARAIAAGLSEQLGTHVDPSAVILCSTPARLTIALTQQSLTDNDVEVERLLAELESLDDSVAASVLDSFGSSGAQLSDSGERILE